MPVKRVFALLGLRPRGGSVRRSLALSLAALAAATSCGGGGKGGGGGSAGSCIAPERPVLGDIVALDPVFDPLQFRSAVALYQRPGDDDRWYVVEKRGTVQTFLGSDPSTMTQWVDLLAEVDDGASEAGLLGFAFHPDFQVNGRVFVSYTAPGSGPDAFVSTIGEISGTADGLAGMGPVTEILTLGQPYSNHNGGDIKFGQDGMLYISFGDGGLANDPLGAGQDTGMLLGKMLRIDVDSATPYAIPPDNPFAMGGGGLPEIYAWGLRNMWRFSFDRLTGDLWGGDVGQGDIEEVDVVTLGGNYGWDEKEGTECFEASSPCDDPMWTDPVVEYDHGDGASITGGYVYRGTAIPELAGAHIYGDYDSGTIWALPEGATVAQPILDSGLSISTFGEGADGELYVVDYRTASSRIYRIVPSEGQTTGNLPVLLSDTGCVKDDAPQKPIAALIPYDVNVPLWSDGASKRRWLSLPEGEQITIEADGDWTLPQGAVLLKEFQLGRRLETRFFLRHIDDGSWGGYTYEWADDESDATLLVGGKEEAVGGDAGDQVWTYPSGTECLGCHTEAAGASLGLETAQMNRDFPAGSGHGGNQIEWMRDRGLFANDPGDASGLPAFPSIADESASLESRARAYLHANCSNCHRPGGTTQASMDLRASTALADTETCNELPEQGDFGNPDARLLVPGNAKDSLLVIRMHRLGDGRMPDLASSVVDTEGATIVQRWIDSLAACP